MSTTRINRAKLGSFGLNLAQPRDPAEVTSEALTYLALPEAADFVKEQKPEIEKRLSESGLNLLTIVQALGAVPILLQVMRTCAVAAATKSESDPSLNKTAKTLVDSSVTQRLALVKQTTETMSCMANINIKTRMAMDCLIQAASQLSNLQDPKVLEVTSQMQQYQRCAVALLENVDKALQDAMVGLLEQTDGYDKILDNLGEEERQATDGQALAGTLYEQAKKQAEMDKKLVVQREAQLKLLEAELEAAKKEFAAFKAEAIAALTKELMDAENERRQVEGKAETDLMAAAARKVQAEQELKAAFAKPTTREVMHCLKFMLIPLYNYKSTQEDKSAVEARKKAMDHFSNSAEQEAQRMATIAADRNQRVQQIISDTNERRQKLEDMQEEREKEYKRRADELKAAVANILTQLANVELTWQSVNSSADCFKQVAKLLHHITMAVQSVFHFTNHMKGSMGNLMAQIKELKDKMDNVMDGDQEALLRTNMRELMKQLYQAHAVTHVAGVLLTRAGFEAERSAAQAMLDIAYQTSEQYARDVTQAAKIYLRQVPAMKNVVDFKEPLSSTFQQLQLADGTCSVREAA